MIYDDMAGVWRMARYADGGWLAGMADDGGAGLAPAFRRHVTAVCQFPSLPALIY